MNSVEVVELKPKKRPISLILQGIFIMGTLLSGVATLLSKDWLPLFYFMLSLTLFTMAWNYYKLAKKKRIPILYVAFAVVTLISAILELL